MKKNIFMCNYYGMCDSNGNAVGHTVKVTKEYAKMLEETYNICLMASPCITKEMHNLDFDKVIALKYDIQIDDDGFLKHLTDKFKVLFNIHQIFDKDGLYFFYQVDFFFFFFILLFYRRTKNRNVYCLIYHQNFVNGISGCIFNEIYRRALNKIDGVVYTQKEKKILHNHTIWIPDYMYSDNQYIKYRNMKKQNQVVCVGTMNKYKQLEEIVRVFSVNQVKLLIVGRFDNQNRFEKLVKIKSDNVSIYNTNLSYEQYLELLAASKYSILPYDMRQYVNRTSGVLLESIYVGSIPIAPKELLEQTGIEGIGYNRIEDLTEKVFKTEYKFNFEQIYSEYNEENLVSALVNFFND